MGHSINYSIYEKVVQHTKIRIVNLINREQNEKLKVTEDSCIISPKEVNQLIDLLKFV